MLWIMWIGAYKVSRSLNLQSYDRASESVAERSLFMSCTGFIGVNLDMFGEIGLTWLLDGLNGC